eukprot:Platyproteum_vivax@DN6592_c0_g1_i4.p1
MSHESFSFYPSFSDWTPSGLVPAEVEAIWQSPLSELPEVETSSPPAEEEASPPVTQRQRTAEGIPTALFNLIPRDENGAMLSVGSIPHTNGTCKPCVFAFHASKPCLNGVNCGFCHYHHAPKKRCRAPKKKRNTEHEEENDLDSQPELQNMTMQHVDYGQLSPEEVSRVFFNTTETPPMRKNMLGGALLHVCTQQHYPNDGVDEF